MVWMLRKLDNSFGIKIWISDGAIQFGKFYIYFFDLTLQMWLISCWLKKKYNISKIQKMLVYVICNHFDEKPLFIMSIFYSHKKISFISLDFSITLSLCLCLKNWNKVNIISMQNSVMKIWRFFSQFPILTKFLLFHTNIANITNNNKLHDRLKYIRVYYDNAIYRNKHRFT